MPSENTLTDWERLSDRFQVISLADEGLISIFEAAKALNISVRHAFRLRGKFRQYRKSIEAFIFKPRGNPKRKKQSTVSEIIRLKKEKPERSCCFITDKVSQTHEKVSRTTVWTILKRKGLLTKRVKRRKPYRRFEAEAFGQLWQMDTSEGYWLEGYGRLKLILILDDYSRVIVSGGFFEEDSTWNNMKVLRTAMETYGLPKIIYTDNDTKFIVTERESRHYEYRDPVFYETEIQRALLELGVVLIRHQPYRPQAKGKIERVFQTIQNRFIREHTASNLEELNDQFSEWVEWYNHHWKHSGIDDFPISRRNPDVLRRIPSGINLDDVFCLKETRVVQKDNSISFKGTRLFISRKFHLVGCEAKVHFLPPNRVRIFHRGGFVQELLLS